MSNFARSQLTLGQASSIAGSSILSDPKEMAEHALRTLYFIAELAGSTNEVDSIDMGLLYHPLSLIHALIKLNHELEYAESSGGEHE